MTPEQDGRPPEGLLYQRPGLLRTLGKTIFEAGDNILQIVLVFGADILGTDTTPQFGNNTHIHKQYSKDNSLQNR